TAKTSSPPHSVHSSPSGVGSPECLCLLRAIFIWNLQASHPASALSAAVHVKAVKLGMQRLHPPPCLMEKALGDLMLHDRDTQAIPERKRPIRIGVGKGPFDRIGKGGEREIVRSGHWPDTAKDSKAGEPSRRKVLREKVACPWLVERIRV